MSLKYQSKMKRLVTILGLTAIILVNYSFSSGTIMKKESVYKITRLKQPMKIDANWDKAQWKNVQPVDITNYMGDIPGFKPAAQAKMMYDDNNIYVIFHVK